MGQGAKHCVQNRLGGKRSGQGRLWKLMRGKLHIWEVAPWENTIGKLPLGQNYTKHLSRPELMNTEINGRNDRVWKQLNNQCPYLVHLTRTIGLGKYPTCHMYSVQTPWLFVLAKFIVCNVRPSTLNCKDKKISSLDMGRAEGVLSSFFKVIDI